MRVKRMLLVGLLAAFVAGMFALTADAAVAQKKKKRKKVDRKALFEKLRTTKTKKKVGDKEVDVLTKAEFLAQFKNEKAKTRGERLFTRLDKDSDGVLTLEEFTAPRKKKKKKNE